MCGIAGIFNTDRQPPNRDVLALMSRAIAHRGPDGERFYFDDASGIGFAHRHLRIIDLSDAALQPMCNEDGSLWLIFNGEIYNYVELRPELEARGHRFSSHSDSETILHAYEEWGPDCLKRFNGMFAFALWDSRKQTLFIARDRMGVKPLYYWWHNKTLAFASEIKALLQHPDMPSEPYMPAIAQYMSAMYTVGVETWFAGIRRLLPGHYMLVTPDDLTVRQWWDLPDYEDEPGAHSEHYYVNKTRELLEDSVHLRLRSDVPLGSHLSGGIDSSAIVALLSSRLAESGERLRTFSGAFAGGPDYDERGYVRQVVRRYKTDHRETLPTASDLPRLLERMVAHMDEPAAGPGIVLQWAVCNLTKQSGVIVVNGGQGGDETWGGYFGYIPAYLKTLVRQARHHPALYGELLCDTTTLMRRPALRRSLLNVLRSRRRGRLQAENELGEWAGERFAGSPGGLSHPTHNALSSTRSPLANAMYYDLKWYLPALLQVEDRTSMAFGLESRAPLLDYRLLEHSATVPSPMRMEGLQMKHVLRSAVKDLLPPAIYNRTDKKGMPTPIAPWFRGELAPWVESTLTSPQAIATGLFSPQYVRQTLQSHISGAKDASIELWKMLNVITWWNVYMES
jgi:asparagine synthase (glutamine-hydrolysing)